MRNYWCNTKFADVIRGNPKPESGTSDQWNAWDKTTRTIYPIRYWLAEEGLTYLQNFIFYIPDKIHSLAYFIYNIRIGSHRLSTRFKLGSYNEIDELIFHSLFETLVDFIEIEKAHMGMWSNSYKKRWVEHIPFISRLLINRNPEMGLKYLEWEMSLEGDNNRQAISAKEQYDLYMWYKYDYLNRPEPGDVTGLYAFYNSTEYNGIFSPMTEERRRLFDLTCKLEDEYARKDDEMLMRLIKIRRELWT